MGSARAVLLHLSVFLTISLLQIRSSCAEPAAPAEPSLFAAVQQAQAVLRRFSNPTPSPGCPGSLKPGPNQLNIEIESKDSNRDRKPRLHFETFVRSTIPLRSNQEANEIHINSWSIPGFQIKTLFDSYVKTGLASESFSAMPAADRLNEIRAHEPLLKSKSPDESIARHLETTLEQLRKLDLVSNRLTLPLQLITWDGAHIKDRKTRMSRFAKNTAGLSEIEKLQLGAVLGGRLSSIYDYARARNGPNSEGIVTQSEQYQAILDWGNAGVCRDAAVTLGEYYVAAGFDPKKVIMRSFATSGAHHVVLQVTASDGRKYQTNWDELLDSTSSPISASIPTLGTTIGIYDWKGQQIGSEKSPLGTLLWQVSAENQAAPSRLPHVHDPSLAKAQVVRSFGDSKKTQVWGSYSGGVFTGVTQNPTPELVTGLVARGTLESDWLVLEGSIAPLRSRQGSVQSDAGFGRFYVKAFAPIFQRERSEGIRSGLDFFYQTEAGGIFGHAKDLSERDPRWETIADGEGHTGPGLTFFHETPRSQIKTSASLDLQYAEKDIRDYKIGWKPRAAAIYLSGELSRSISDKNDIQVDLEGSFLRYDISHALKAALRNRKKGREIAINWARENSTELNRLAISGSAWVCKSIEVSLEGGVTLTKSGNIPTLSTCVKYRPKK